MKKVRHYLFTRIRHWLIVQSIEALHSPSGGPQASPLFKNQRNNQQTALPLPATGDQTAPKGCPRQGQPCTADEGETPELRERPGHAMRPANPSGRRERQSFELAPRASALRGAGPHAPCPVQPGTQSCSVHVVRTCDPWRTGTDCRHEEEARSPHRRSLTCNQRRGYGT